MKDVVSYGVAEKKVIEISDTIEFWSDKTNWNDGFKDEARACAIFSAIIRPAGFVRAPRTSSWRWEDSVCWN